MGKSSISMCHLYHGYVSHNQMVILVHYHTSLWESHNTSILYTSNPLAIKLLVAPVMRSSLIENILLATGLIRTVTSPKMVVRKGIHLKTT